MQPVRTLSAAVFFLIALAHLARFLFRVPVVVGGLTVPVWASGPACVALLTLAVLLLREGRK